MGEGNLFDERAPLPEDRINRALPACPQAKKRDVVSLCEAEEKLGRRLAAVPRVEAGRERHAHEDAAPGRCWLFVRCCHTWRSMSEVSVIVAAHNADTYLERCLEALVERGHELIVVDNASTDGTAALARASSPETRVLALDENKGYGAALNAGLAIASRPYVLLLNADAWPREGAIEALVDFARSDPGIGVVGPRLLNVDGTLQPSVRGFPTPWRLATEYFFLRWLAPRSRLMNAFYGAGFDHRSPRDAEFLVGAVLLVPQPVIEEIGAFDTDFFMFNEEVDLCYRVRQRGLRVTFFPGAEFVHLGGSSTRLQPSRMYREQLLSHLRFQAKHHGLRAAERARRVMLWAMRLRGLVFRGERRQLSREAAAYLARGDAATLLESPAL
jgi:N-acetylglucosaminyl-diphospho-decaprenol L-rhamnosyltransferase